VAEHRTAPLTRHGVDTDGPSGTASVVGPGWTETGPFFTHEDGRALSPNGFSDSTGS